MGQPWVRSGLCLMQGGSVGKVSEAYTHHSYTHPETRGPPFIVILHPSITPLGLPWWLSGKESTCDVGDAGHSGSIPGSGRSPGGGHGYTLQYSCQENPMDRGAWRATVHRAAKSQTRLSD